MAKNWILRAACLALASLTLSGCIIVPGRHYERPVYYYR